MLIVDLWRRMKGAFFCISTKSSTGEWKDHYFARDQLDRVRSFIANNRDKDLYWCPHGLKKKSRKEDSAVLPNMLWADLDAADPRKITPKPTIALESSPGRYVGLWLIDEPMDKELNKALTYHVGADKSGWDLGQVLRIPDTTNYKYPTQPKTRTLWDDCPHFTKKAVTKIVASSMSKKATTAEGQSISIDPNEVFQKYQRRFPVWVRRELMRRDPPSAGKRSEMIWKLEHALLECGCDHDEAFVLIRASVWNKFRGRHNEDEQLKRELDKIVEQRFEGERPSLISAAKTYQFCAKPISEVEEQPIDWVWHGRLARGELTIVEGDPGLGKSYFVQMIARHLCDGEKLPGMLKKPSPSKVVYFDIENSDGSVTKPRLMDNGLKNGANFFQEALPFTIEDEDSIEGAEGAIERIRPSVVVFDTLNNYIGTADIHKSNEAQQAMTWFSQLARRYGCAVIVLRHLTKGNKEKALYRGQGSIAFAGVARLVMTIGLHPDDQDVRVAAVTKTNLSKYPPSIMFRITPLPDLDKRKDRSRLEFEGLTDLTADDIVSVTRKAAVKEKDGAGEFLKNVLGDGAVEASKVETMAEKRNISKRTLQRAADDMGIVRTKRGFGSTSATMWELPD